MKSTNYSASIIIPNYNGQKLLAQYLPKVIEAAKGNEVIVVDDASPNDDVSYLAKNFPTVKVVALKTNQLPVLTTADGNGAIINNPTKNRPTVFNFFFLKTAIKPEIIRSKSKQ